MERNRRESEAIRREYEQKYKKAEQEIERREKEAERKLEKARADAESIVASAKASVKYIMDELNSIKKKQNERGFSEGLDETRRLVKKEFEKLDSDLSKKEEKPKEEENYVLPRPLKKGDEVYIRSLDKNGFLDADPDKSGNVMVNIGIFSLGQSFFKGGPARFDVMKHQNVGSDFALCHKITDSRSHIVKLFIVAPPRLMLKEGGGIVTLTDSAERVTLEVLTKVVDSVNHLIFEDIPKLLKAYVPAAKSKGFG
jgi:hypothetical protein